MKLNKKYKVVFPEGVDVDKVLERFGFRLKSTIDILRNSEVTVISYNPSKDFDSAKFGPYDLDVMISSDSLPFNYYFSSALLQEL